MVSCERVRLSLLADGQENMTFIIFGNQSRTKMKLPPPPPPPLGVSCKPSPVDPITPSHSIHQGYTPLFHACAIKENLCLCCILCAIIARLDYFFILQISCNAPFKGGVSTTTGSAFRFVRLGSLTRDRFESSCTVATQHTATAGTRTCCGFAIRRGFQ